MDTLRINSGEFIALNVIKIKQIPHITIVTDDLTIQGQEYAVENSAREMSGMLSEIYQQYKDIYVQEGVNQDVALELAWVSEPVENQPFKASVTLYYIIRAINVNQLKSENLVSSFSNIVKSTLDSGKYDFEEINFKDFANLFEKVSKSDIRAIVKEERVESLQNAYMPTCYAYDILPLDYGDLSKLANILISHPNSAVSFQLIPTFYNNNELAELNNINQNVSILSRGVSDSQIGTVSISIADNLSSLYHYYSENKSRALFNYNIIVYASDASVASISTRLLGQLATTKGAAPNLSFVKVDGNEFISTEQTLYPLPWVVNDIVINKGRNASIWEQGLASPALYRFPLIITADEAASFFRLPIGSDKIGAGYSINEAGKTSRTYSRNLINSGDIELGVLRSSSQGNTIGLSLKDLAKHMLVVGTPGSGKTTFSVGLLDRLWKEHKIPFLVIEPAKNEYRALVQSIPDLQVFTPGKNFISPFVFNPFVPPKNVKLETYKSTLKTAFAAGVSMSTPLDKIFEDTINNCYSDFRWLDNYTIDDKGKVFNITDFIKCFQETFDEIGYTGDARNIGRAGIVRLKSLVNLFDNYFSIPIEDILTKPTIIELAAIENSDQKALIIALLLLSILAYVNANYVGEGGLKNFILLEEAHVLLDSSSDAGGEGAANPAAIAQGLVKRMLAEIRSYGVGLAIADQSPRKVGIDIVALTDIKIAFRLVEGQDKSILADSTSMSDVQVARLAKLKPGEAFLFFNRLDEPEEIVTPDYRLNNNISISLSDDGIRELSTYWKNKQEKLRPYPECELCPYCQKTCDYNRRILAKEVARRIFKNNIGVGCKDFERLKHVFANISKLIKGELNDEPFTPELKSCVKVYLWRHVKYDTALRVKEETINKSLIKE